MSYRLLPNGKHQWEFRLGGAKTPRRIVTAINFRDGEKEVRRLRYEFENGLSPLTPGRGICFYDICDDYLNGKQNERGKKAWQTLSSHIRCFKVFIGNYRLDEFNQRGSAAYNAVATWMQGYKSSKNRLGGSISPQAVNRKFNTLRAIFNTAINRGLMRDNPCKRAKKLRSLDPLPRFLSKEQIQALVDSSPRKLFTDYCTIILNTGMRPNEALGIQVEQIDLGHAVIRGFKQKNYRELGTTKIKDSLVGPLKRMIGNRKTGQLLTGYTEFKLRHDAEIAIKESKINDIMLPGTSKFTIYGLRHTFASHMLMSGESIESVAGWLRNSIEICYRHYSHLTKEYLLKAGNSIDLMPKTQLKVIGNE